MKVNNELKKEIKKMNGNVLAIGLSDETLLDTIENNNNILMCDLLNANIKSNIENKAKSHKKIYINDIRKKYKNKKIEYIICDIREVDKYLKTFVRDSIYINKKEIYFYMDKNVDKNKIIKKYKRYNTVIKETNCNDGFIIKINTEQAKNNIFKDKIYYLKDTLEYISDFIGDFLSN